MNPWRGISIKGLWVDRQRNDVLWAQIAEERSSFLKEVSRWWMDAIKDGWTSRPTYNHEPEINAFTLDKEGFKAMGLARPGSDKSLPTAEISIWGPDGLVIEPPRVYDWPTIKHGVETCNYCGKFPSKTGRVAFAGRACETCLPIETAKLPPNWAE